jgi:DNA excision repair protein ERCC-3
MAVEPSGKPLIIQSDGSLLLDVHDPSADEARADIGAFCELEKSPEHIHTYRITPLSLWNAASAGLAAEEVQARLVRWSRYGIPQSLLAMIVDHMGRFGTVILTALDERRLLLRATEEKIRRELGANRKLAKYLIPSGDEYIVDLVDRGTVKQELIKIGYPVKDEAPLADGERLEISLRERALSGRPFTVRDYQTEAAESFTGRNEPGTGFGTIVLP